MRVLVLYMGLLVGFVVMLMMVLAMTGCAAAGFWQMSDQWCQDHLQASANRCPGR